MNYDRLLQLGGIDREVPPIPPYISKEELKKWQDDQEKEIPDGVIKGVKELEDFLNGVSDSETLNAILLGLANNLIGTSQDQPASSTINGAKAYADYVVALRRTETIFIGVAQEGEELTTTPQVISQLQETSVDLSMFDDYLYIIFPKTRGIVATMSSIDIPFTKIGEETIEGVVYSILKSNSTYTGELKVALLLKY